jgi:hypothetical protein
MNAKFIAEILGGLAILKFFPSDDQARTAIFNLVCSMATTEDQVRWLVKRTVALHNEWPGPKELRAVFCSKFKPRDGVEAHSQIYLEGIPSEKPEALTLPVGGQKALPSGAEISAAPTLGIAIRDLARAKDLTRIGQPVPRVRDIPLVQITDANRITEEDVRREVDRLREQRARQELGGDIA